MKLKIKVHYIKDDLGKITDVSISVKDFEKLIDELSDLQDLKTIYQRSDEKSIPYDQIRKELFGNGRKK